MAKTLTVRFSESRDAWVVKKGRRIAREFESKGAALDWSRDTVIDSSTFEKRVAFTKSGSKQSSKTLVRKNDGSGATQSSESTQDDTGGGILGGGGGGDDLLMGGSSGKSDNDDLLGL